MDSTYYDMYRGSTLGLALADTIDEYVRLNVLTGSQGIIIMQQFDRAMTQALTAKVKAKTSVKAHLRTYNDYQEVWTFYLRNATFIMDDRTAVSTDRIKIIACKGEGADSASKKQGKQTIGKPKAG
ncbi:transcription initiation factor IIA gamma subunit [Mycena vitilis]|nr:transcription initiation factor IIA gamma subunit [Mycena vitilis]